MGAGLHADSCIWS